MAQKFDAPDDSRIQLEEQEPGFETGQNDQLLQLQPMQDQKNATKSNKTSNATNVIKVEKNKTKDVKEGTKI